MTNQQLIAFSKAWASRDIGQAMRFFTEDCEYATSTGKVFRGWNSVAEGVAEMMQYDASAQATVSNIKITGSFGYWEWEYTFPDGQIIYGCDCFEFMGNLIRKKNAFRKIQLNP